MSGAEKKQLVWGIVICTIAALFYCYEYFLRIIPGALQVELQQAFGNITATTFGNLTAYYYYAYTAMQIPVGVLMDRFGPKRSLFVASLFCSIGSALFTYTGSLVVAAFGRFLVGFGSAFAFVGVLTLTHVWLPRKYFSLVVGIVTTLAMLSAIAGEVGIALLSQKIGWQVILSSTAWVGLAITAFILLFVKDSPTKIRLKNISRREFIKDVWRVFSTLQVWLIGIVGALIYWSLSVFAEVWGKTYLEVVHQLSPVDAAKAVSMVFFGWAIGAPLGGAVSDWTGKRILPLVFGSVMAALCISAVLYIPSMSITNIKLLLLMYGVFSGTEIIIFVMAKENCSAKLAGTVFAVVNMIVMLGGSIFQPLVGFMLDKVWSGEMYNGARVYSAADYQIVLSILPLGLIVVAILAFFLGENTQKQQYQ